MLARCQTSSNSFVDNDSFVHCFSIDMNSDIFWLLLEVPCFELHAKYDVP